MSDGDSLKNNPQRLCAILDGFEDPFCLLDHELRYIFINKKAGIAMGVSPDTLVNRLVVDVFPAFQGSVFQANYVKALKEQTTVIFEDYFDPLKRWFSIRATPNAEGLALYFKDVTAVHKAQEQNRIQQERYETTLRSIGDAVIATTADSTPLVEFMNPIAEALTGWTLLEAKGRPIQEVFNIINQNTRKPAENPIDRVLQEGRIVGLANHTILVSKIGHEHIIEDSAAPILDAKNELEGVVLVFRDVTEQRKLEAQKEEANRQVAVERAKLQTYLEQAPVGISIIRGNNFVFEIANHEYQRFVGDTRNLIGVPFFEAFPETADQPIRKVIESVYLTGQTYRATDYPVELKTANGEMKRSYFDFLLQPIFSAEEKVEGVLTIALETTNQVEARKSVGNQGKWLESVLNLLPVGLVMMDVDTRTHLFSNHLANTYFKFATDLDTGFSFESEALKVADLDGKILPLYQTPRAKAVDGQKVVNEQVIWKSDDGDMVMNINSDIIPAIFGHGRTALLTMQDITSIKQTEKELKEISARYKALADFSPIMVALRDPDQNVIFFNQSFSQYAAFLPGETKRREEEYFIHPDDYPKLLSLRARAAVNKLAYESEVRIKRFSDGMYRWHLNKVAPIKDERGNIVNWLSVGLDIHDKRLAVASEQSARKQAESANFAKTQFLTNMSHEIRTPLGAILGFTDLLKDEKTPVSERSQYLDIISKNGRALTQIIDDILDLSKVESGHLEVERVEFSFHDLVREVIELFFEGARSKNISISYDLAPGTPDRISSDPSRLRQILINIVGNAVKFTSRGSVQVKVNFEKQLNHFCLFKVSVIDTGIGLTEEQKERLFQPFMQADNSTSRRFGGSGLGLALSRRLARALGGDIEIESFKHGVGTTFAIFFMAEEVVPVQIKVPAKEEGNGEILPLPLQGVKVLVADDSLDNQFLVRRLLVKSGAEVETANDGLEAYTKTLAYQPDVILMDIQMPGMDGYEATRKLREANFTKPIIALTAHAMAEERLRTASAGFVAHLTKPLNATELVETVRKMHLSSKSSSESLR